MKKGKTFIICGPSGVGKGTVVARLLASDPTLYFSISATTRAPRPGEEDGVHYHFLTKEKFEGAEQIHQKRPEAVRIYIAPPSWEELERRLIGRGTEDMEKVRSRLARGKEEFAAAKDFDYFVINDTVEHAVEEIRAIMTAEHCRPVERICRAGLR